MVSESGDLEWNVNIVSSDEQESECFDESSINHKIVNR